METSGNNHLYIDYKMRGLGSHSCGPEPEKEIEASLSKYLQEVRDSAKADGEERIYIHGEKEAEAREKVLANGVYLNDKTYDEMKMIGEFTGASEYLPEYLD